MTNVEKYFDKLKKLRGDFTVDSNDNIIRCTEKSCEDCKFNNASVTCDVSRINWLFQECKSELSEEEEILIEHTGIITNAKYKYIARDNNGNLFLYTDKPIKSGNVYCTQKMYLKISKELFPWIQYSDGAYDIKAKSFIE